MRRFLAMLPACLWACGDNAPPADADLPSPMFEPAPHAPLPVVFGHSKLVLSSVQLVTITYDDYAGRDDVEAFGDVVVSSPWYSAVGSEYSVLGGSGTLKVHLGPAPAALTRDLIEAQIRQVLTSHLAPMPPVTGNQLLYMLYVPLSVARGPDLVGVHGYHQILLMGQLRVPIAVVLDDGSGLATTTVTAAHQLINAATNPYDPPTDGYYADPPMTDPWSLALGEVADLCERELPIAMDEEHPRFAVPRVYSNHAASAGGGPCTPLGSPPGSPSGSDDAWTDVSAEPSRIQMVPRGESVTFHLTGWSTQPVSDWTLRTLRADISNLSEAEMDPELSSDTINNGRKVTLTLHAPQTATSGAVGGLYVLSGPSSHPWVVGFVVQ